MTHRGSGVGGGGGSGLSAGYDQREAMLRARQKANSAGLGSFGTVVTKPMGGARRRQRHQASGRGGSGSGGGSSTGGAVNAADLSAPMTFKSTPKLA